MAFIKRLRGRMSSRKSAARQLSTTPVFDRSMKAQVYGGLLKITCIILVPLFLLIWFGHPALRVSYTWNGNKYSPFYYECKYLAYDGMHRIWPKQPGGPCPLITFFPVPFDLNL